MNVGIPILSFLGILLIAGATATTGKPDSDLVPTVPAVADLGPGLAQPVAAAAPDFGSYAGAGNVAKIIDPLYLPYLLDAGVVSGGYGMAVSAPAPTPVESHTVALSVTAGPETAWSWDAAPPDAK